MLPGRQFTLDWALKALGRHRWLLAGPLFLGAMGGLLYSRFQPSLYRSDAVVQVVPQRIPDTYVQSTVTDRVEERLTSLAQQVLSRTQLEAVINEFGLYSDERRKWPMDDVFDLMKKRVQVTPLEASSRTRPEVDAFRVSFDYEDPRIARDVVARLASFFIDRNAQERGSQADQASAFLVAQLADARTRLEASERKLKVFRERNAGRLPTQTQANMQAIQTAQLGLQSTTESLARDRDRQLLLERLYADAASEPPAPAPTTTPVPSGSPGEAIEKMPVDASPQERLEAARMLLADLQRRYSAKHPDVIRTTHLIEDLEKQVKAGGEPRPASQEDVRRREKLREMRAELESLDRQIAFKEGEVRRMRSEIGAYQARLEAVPGIESEWVALTRDYDTLQESYKQLLAKSENSKIAASLEQRQIGEQFKILDPPRIPPKPSSPKRIQINMIGTLAGLGLGVFLVGFLEYRDSTMRTESDLLGAIDLPVLVLLPLVTTEADLLRAKHRRVLMSASVTVGGLATAALCWFLQLWKYVV